MSKKIRFLIMALSFALVASVSLCVALLAEGADENSIIRLVSFDYIENTLRSYIDDNDDAAQKEITVLKGQLLEAEKKIAELEEQLGSGGEYTTLVLQRGQSLKLSAGCEFVLVSGRVENASGELCDITDGDTVLVGDSIESSHSIVSGGDSEISVSTGEVVILIRGEYIKNG